MNKIHIRIIGNGGATIIDLGEHEVSKEVIQNLMGHWIQMTSIITGTYYRNSFWKMEIKRL